MAPKPAKGGVPKKQRREDPDNAAPPQSVRELNRLVKRVKLLRVNKITKRLKDAKKDKVVEAMTAQLEAAKRFDIHATVKELIESIGAVLPPKVAQEWERATKNDERRKVQQVSHASALHMMCCASVELHPLVSTEEEWTKLTHSWMNE
jgi:hypothetical protein